MKHRSTVFSKIRRVAFVAVAALTIALLAYVTRPLGPHDLPRDARALTFVDRNRLPLGTILGRDDRHTIAVPLSQIAPSFEHAVLAVEDRRFFQHGALDPTSTLRALSESVRRRRLPSGASTLSMQLARLLWPVTPDLAGKVAEVVRAQRLENGLTKEAILEAYCNRAPMGSNLYGVEAAARTYFGARAAQLDLAQAALLAALPNDPVRLDPYRHWAALRARQRIVLARMHAAGFIDGSEAARAAIEDVALRPRGGGIVAAPHLLFLLAPQVSPEAEIVRTTVDRSLQQFVAAQTRAVIDALGAEHVHDAAAIVVDNHAGEVLAYVGSPDYFHGELGRNDGVQALRQPGSALKPFLYELALERRAIRPTTILADVPASYALPGGRLYRPQDYTARFNGPVRVRIALADSLNVPAVRVLERTGVDAFLARLHALGFAGLARGADFYGLGLTLGGGEVSLWELARAYATMARQGAPTRLLTTFPDAGAFDRRAASAAPGDPHWALVADMLADPQARAGAFGVDSILALPFAAAVKTGTSSDFRDTWTVGFTPDYTVAVWVGNFDGSPMHGVSGVTGAAPLWNRIMLRLYERREAPPSLGPPRGFARAPICALTGTKPAPNCGPVVMEYLDRADRLAYDRSAAFPRRAPSSGVYDAWLAAQPRREDGPTRILFPRDGDRFAAYPNAGEALKFIVAGRQEKLSVALDGRSLEPRGGDFVWPLRTGSFDLTVRWPHGADHVHFTVTPPAPHGRTGFALEGATVTATSAKARRVRRGTTRDR